MGFTKGAYARIWSVDDEGNYSTANISVSKKNQDTGNYDLEFSHGYVRLVGWAHEKAKKLDLPNREQFKAGGYKGVPIQILSCDVSNKYDPKKKTVYTNYVVFGFEVQEGTQTTTEEQEQKAEMSKKKIEDQEDDDDLPF